MRHIILILSMLMTTQLYAAGKIQGADVKTEAELIAAGATKAQMIKDSQIYITANGVNDKMSTAITSGLLGGLPSWETAKSYSVGQAVTESSKIYKCLIAHTSGTFATDLAAVRWGEISAGFTDHTSLTNIGTNTHAQIDTHIANTSNPHSVTKTQVGLPNVANIDTTTTANISDSTNKRFVTDANLTTIGNQSGVNTGDQTITLNGMVTGSGVGTFTTSFGTFASSALTTAVSDETGSGALVFASTPTLVTPVLGAATGTSLALGGSLTAGTLISASSTTAAVIFPRMTSAQKNAITPVAGMELYDTDLNIKQYYNGSQWIANTNVQLDDVYSATVTNASVVADENKEFIASCTNANPAVCTLNAFTIAPTCVAVAQSPGDRYVTLSTSTSTSVSIYQWDQSGAPTRTAFNISCQKTGADYQSANALIASNSNYSSASSTPTFSGISTLTPSSNMCVQARDGEEMVVRCNVSAASSAASLFSMTIPDSKSIDSAKVVSTATTAGPCKSVGTWRQNGGTQLGAILTCPGTSTTLLYLGHYTNTAGQLTPQLGNIITTSSNFDVNYRIPISGWANSNVIVASLAGTPNIPGSTVKVDNIAFSYGTTNATTRCTASPCSYLDQLGSGSITSVTRSGTGVYALNFPRTYSKLKCWGNCGAPGIGANCLINNPPRCESCSTVALNTVIASTEAATDSLGNINCIGEY